MVKKVIFLLLSLLGSPSYAQNASDIFLGEEDAGRKYIKLSDTHYLLYDGEIPYTLKAEKGQPLQVVLNDGREMEVVSEHKKIDTPVDIQFIESSCGDQIRIPKCSVVNTASEYRLTLRWKTHPDSTRVGKQVEMVSPKDENISSSDDVIEEIDGKKFIIKKFEDTGNLVTWFQKNMPVAAKEEKPFEVQCDNYDWVTGAPNSIVPAHIDIEEMTTETMLPNQETFVSENAAFMTATGINMSYLPESKLFRAESFRQLIFGSFETVFVYGDVIGFTLKNAAGQICETAFKPDRSQFEKAYNAEYSSPTPVIFGGTNVFEAALYSDLPTIASNTKDFLGTHSILEFLKVHNTRNTTHNRELKAGGLVTVTIVRPAVFR